MREITNRIINRIPNFYTREDRSVLLSIIDSISYELEVLYNNVDIISDIISIDKVRDDDLYSRFGALLNIYKYEYETNEMYRNRIKSTVMSGRYGGIVESIKNSVASYVGLYNSNDIDKYIYVCGAWEYDGRFGNISDIDTSPGNLVCAIDPDILVCKDWVTTDGLVNIINSVKAGGINVYTTYVYNTLYDESNMSIYESDDTINIKSSHNDNNYIRVHDDRERIVISIGLQFDDGSISVDDCNSVLNISKLNDTLILNNINSYDVINGMTVLH